MTRKHILKYCGILLITLVALTAVNSVYCQKKADPLAKIENPCDQETDIKNDLIDTAEREYFNTSRVEIVGNTKTWGMKFFRRMANGMNEGDIFKRKSLEKSIRSLSKMKQIFPISIDNVKVYLYPSKKVINFTFCVEEKP